MDELGDEDHDGARLIERAVPEVIRRLIERAVVGGVERLSEAPENIRDLVGDLKLPKEALQYIYHNVDDTKKGVYRVVAKEIRDVLEHTNLSDEIAEVLTKLSFEISTTIRFVSNDAARGEDDEPDQTEGEESPQASAKKRPNKVSSAKIPSPKVVSKVVMKAVDALDRRGKE